MATTTTTTSSPLPLPIRITILISGTGTNLQALIDATTAPTPPHPSLQNTQIVRVISDKKNAFGLTRAQNAGIPTKYHNLISGGYTKRHPRPEGSNITGASPEAREAFDKDLAALTLADEPDLVVCAGFMHILSPAFLFPLSSRSPPLPCINLHPARPGMYNGRDAIERAFRDFQEGKVEDGRTGVMVHYVIEDVDMGEVILVEEVEMRVGEGLEELKGRVRVVEHAVIVEGTARAAERFRGQRGTGRGGGAGG